MGLHHQYKVVEARRPDSLYQQEKETLFDHHVAIPGEQSVVLND